MGVTNDRSDRIRTQRLETDRMLGVDFVPLLMEVKPRSQAARTAAAQTPPPTQPSSTLEGKHAPPLDAKTDALDALRVRHDAECPHCTVADAHTQTVFGEGNPDADLMFIGEAPGQEEDRTGRPFVGRAGQKLNEMIVAMKLRREDVYIANVLKSRPPNNRTPLQAEVDACSPYLAEQIRIIQPKVIVTLGGPAAKLMLKVDVGITRLRGQWAEYVDPDGQLRVPIMPTFHPAYLLRNYTRETRQKVWSDLKATMERLDID